MPGVCPACRARSAPVFRALCSRCWQYLPPEVARPHLKAWRNRVSDPPQYQESLIRVLRVIHEQGAGNGGAAA